MGMLYFGDNLDIRKRYIKDETVGLVYHNCQMNRRIRAMANR